MKPEKLTIDERDNEQGILPAEEYFSIPDEASCSAEFPQGCIFCE